ncbi:MAG: hypothetical protein IMZ52_02770 [Actinobacteria bacterium]|nr:hypothetical protein [Actinomycetota bacterium]MBE3114840.1 hypothetical protein [Actinomycetota bacterium]
MEVRKKQGSSGFLQAHMQKLAYFGEKVKELTMIEKDIKKNILLSNYIEDK